MALREAIKQLLTRSVPTSPIIALLTDFGLSDHYVGTMKAVIASICPAARVIDVSHEIGARQVREGAYVLWSSYRFFPAGTVFIAVVDPGVGTKRRILGIRTAKYIFLAPDNGLLDFVRADEFAIDSREVRVSGSPYVLSYISSTFHGRDIFAPVAAFLCRGVDFGEIGSPASLGSPRFSFFVPGRQPGTPVILHIDRFGNIITNIRVDPEANSVRSLSIGRKKIDQWVKNYVEAPAGAPCLIVGSGGLIEIVMKNESAGARLKATLESPVRIRFA